MMTKAQCLAFATNQFDWAAKFLKGRDAGTLREGIKCKTYALVYSDRALSRV